MPRYKKQSVDWWKDLQAILKAGPWWIGLVLVPLTWGALYYAFPLLLNALASGEDKKASYLPYHLIASLSTKMAPLIAVVMAFAWLFVLIGRRSEARRLESLEGIASVRALDWRTFEQLLAEAFRRLGYEVEETARGADGGVDLILFRDGCETLVQAKHWKSWRVPVNIIRELNGVRSSESMQDAIVVTSGTFTAEARRFADERGVRLIDGDELVQMISRVQHSKRIVEHQAYSKSDAPPSCPACGRPMVSRVARRGRHAGKDFWGCSAYPLCLGMRSVGGERTYSDAENSGHTALSREERE